MSNVRIPTQNGTKTLAELQAQLAAMQARAEAAEAKAAALKGKVRTVDFRLSIGEKGGLVIYGLDNSRFPTTLYISKWEALMAHLPEIKAFVAANQGKFSRKNTDED